MRLTITNEQESIVFKVSKKLITDSKFEHLLKISEYFTIDDLKLAYSTYGFAKLQNKQQLIKKLIKELTDNHRRHMVYHTNKQVRNALIQQHQAELFNLHRNSFALCKLLNKYFNDHYVIKNGEIYLLDLGWIKYL